MLYLATHAAQQSMIWVNVGDLPSSYQGKNDGVNRLGGFMGVMGQSALDMSGKPPEVDPGDALTAERYGERVAYCTQRWQK